MTYGMLVWRSVRGKREMCEFKHFAINMCEVLLFDQCKNKRSMIKPQAVKTRRGTKKRKKKTNREIVCAWGGETHDMTYSPPTPSSSGDIAVNTLLCNVN